MEQVSGAEARQLAHARCSLQTAKPQLQRWKVWRQQRYLRRNLLHLRVAFTFIVRDGAAYVRRNIHALDNLQPSFREQRIFYIENDSTDGTCAILANLSKYLGRRLSGRCLTGFAQKHSEMSCRARVGSMNCPGRIELLARLRQLALDLALEWWHWDVLISVDLDFVRFSAAQLLATVALGKELDALAMFGSSVVKGKERDSRTYDLDSIRPSSSREAIFDFCLTRVHSAFGGFGIYYALGGAFRNANPRYIPIVKKGKVAPCEHIAFNNRLRAAHPSRPLLVDPRFRPVYAFASDLWWTRQTSLAVGQNGGCSSEFNCTSAMNDQCAVWSNCNAADVTTWSTQAGPQKEDDFCQDIDCLPQLEGAAALEARFVADVTPLPGKSMWTALLWGDGRAGEHVYHAFTGVRGSIAHPGLAYRQLNTSTFEVVDGSTQELSSRIGKLFAEDPRALRLRDGTVLLTFQRYLQETIGALASWHANGSLRQPRLSVFTMRHRQNPQQEYTVRAKNWMPVTQFGNDDGRAQNKFVSFIHSLHPLVVVECDLASMRCQLEFCEGGWPCKGLLLTDVKGNTRFDTNRLWLRGGTQLWPLDRDHLFGFAHSKLWCKQCRPNPIGGYHGTHLVLLRRRPAWSLLHVSQPITFSSDQLALAPLARSCILDPVSIARVDRSSDRVLFTVNANDQWGRCLVAEATGLLSHMEGLVQASRVLSRADAGRSPSYCPVLKQALQDARRACVHAAAPQLEFRRSAARHKHGTDEARSGVVQLIRGKHVALVGPAGYLTTVSVAAAIGEADIVVRPNVRIRATAHSGNFTLLLPPRTTSRCDLVCHSGLAPGAFVVGPLGEGRRTSREAGLSDESLWAYARNGVKGVIVVQHEPDRKANVRNLTAVAPIKLWMSRLARRPVRYYRTGLLCLLEILQQKPAKVSLFGYDFYSNRQRGFPGYYSELADVPQHMHGDSPSHNSTRELKFFVTTILSRHKNTLIIDDHLRHIVEQHQRDHLHAGADATQGELGAERLGRPFRRELSGSLQQRATGGATKVASKAGSKRDRATGLTWLGNTTLPPQLSHTCAQSDGKWHFRDGTRVVILNHVDANRVGGHRSHHLGQAANAHIQHALLTSMSKRLRFAYFGVGMVFVPKRLAKPVRALNDDDAVRYAAIMKKTAPCLFAALSEADLVLSNAEGTLHMEETKSVLEGNAKVDLLATYFVAKVCSFSCRRSMSSRPHAPLLLPCIINT